MFCKLQDKTKLTIDAYNKNFSGYTDKFMNYSPYAMHVIEFAGLLEDDLKYWILDVDLETWLNNYVQ
ncbi:MULTISPECIES: hypothetical protein [Pelosinus]|uniref:Uncharacterized protein n=1 Tax=Pelosinus fermentans B4 TaxID=1149862 RepID=I8RK04_9FIRM|nr:MULTISPECIES: hypothetical protein [Pelosinus]EIW18615.1 hypothetical protein FB4_3118 [Pelosinus fermentans B4]EIW25174.1 hypothetical protein FA11_2722 [Pelosinus fermentans A11]OAM96400.1 hypothetical protein FR7_04422 [Pelosinus fermentans DSM 17108]